jgi:hypothetical protein
VVAALLNLKSLTRLLRTAGLEYHYLSGFISVFGVTVTGLFDVEKTCGPHRPTPMPEAPTSGADPKLRT